METTVTYVRTDQLRLGDVILTSKWDGTPELVTILTLQLLNNDVQMIGTNGFDCLCSRRQQQSLVTTSK